MCMERNQHSHVPVWVKLKNLPLEYWTLDGLSVVASGVGQPLYPDQITRSCSRMDFARVCVLIETTAQLPKTIVVINPTVEGSMGGTCTVAVDYEWLPPKCSTCSSLGHAANACPKNSKSMGQMGSAIQIYIPKVPKSIKSNGARNIGEKKKKVEHMNARERAITNPRPSTYPVWVPKSSGTRASASKPSSTVESCPNLSPKEKDRQLSSPNPKGTRPTSWPCSKPCSLRVDKTNGKLCRHQPRGTRPRTRPCSWPCSSRVQYEGSGKEIAIFNPFAVLDENDDDLHADTDANAQTED